MLGRRFIAFIFHFKHDGDDFIAIIIQFTVDEVALAACSGIIIFFKISLWKHGGAHFIELIFGKVLETFANGFSGLLSLEVFVEIHFIVFGLE